MKKITVLILASMLALSLAACGENSGTAASSTQTASASVTEEKSAETAEKSEAAATETPEATETAAPEETKEPESTETVTPEATEEPEEPAEPSEEAKAIEATLLPLVEGEYKLEDCMKLGEYKGLEAEYVLEEVTDEKVEEQLATYLTAEAIEDPEALVEEGVTVDIDYEGYMDGEQVDSATGNINTLVIGSGQFIDGFEDGLIGMKVGEEKDLDLRFPDDYWNSEMASKDITFHVTLNAIMKMPEMTDEWAAKVSNSTYSTLAELRDATRAQMEEQAAATAMDDVESNLWNQVFEASEFYQLPKDIVDTAEGRYYENYEYNASQYGMTLKDFLEQGYGITEADFAIYAKQYAQNIAKSQLLRDAIWEAEGLSEEDEKYAEYEQELADMYGVTVEEVYSYFGEDEVKGYCQTYYDVDMIKSYANITGLPEE